MTTLYEKAARTNIISNGLVSSNSDEARDIYARAWQLGIVAGLRSVMPLALLVWTKEPAENDGPGSPALKYVTGLAALGEVIADKLPVIPNRLRPGSLTGRLALGALAGALFSRRYQQPALPGAINGALGAGLGALAGFTARFILSDLTGLPDTLWAGLEDAIALRLGLHALNRKQP